MSRRDKRLRFYSGANCYAADGTPAPAGIATKASSLSDILSLDQQLTSVEGQLQQIESHQQALVGEVTFYNVTVNLQSTGLPLLSPS